MTKIDIAESQGFIRYLSKFIECQKLCSMVISGPEYGWGHEIGQWPISHSVACKHQDFDGSFEILMGHLEKKMDTRNLNIHLTAK